MYFLRIEEVMDFNITDLLVIEGLINPLPISPHIHDTKHTQSVYVIVNLEQSYRMTLSAVVWHLRWASTISGESEGSTSS